MSQIGRALEVMCAQISMFLQSEWWRCQYSSAAIMWLRKEGRKVCETRAEGRHAKWGGLCRYNPAIHESCLHNHTLYLGYFLISLLYLHLAFPNFLICLVFQSNILYVLFTFHIATGYGLDNPVFESQQGQKISSSPEFSGPGEKQPEREVDHSPASCSEVKNGWSYTLFPLIYLHGVDRDNFTFLRIYAAC
jgi:hypothetical protein